MDPIVDAAARIGLCANCRHAQPTMSARGSVFYRCLRADTDPTFPKYPQLPVTHCAGHHPTTSISSP